MIALTISHVGDRDLLDNKGSSFRVILTLSIV